MKHSFLHNKELHLVEKHKDSVAEAETYEAIDLHSRLLLYIQAIIFFLTAGILIMVLIVIDKNSLQRNVYTGITIGTMVLTGAAFFLNRRKHYHLSAVLTIAAAIFGPWASLLFDPAVFYGDYFPLVFTAISVTLSSIFLPLTATMLIAGVQFAALTAVVLLSPASESANVASFLTFILFLSIISILSNYIRAKDLKKIDSQKKQLIQISKQLHELSIHDHLTGLFNRRYFEITLDHEIERSHQGNISIGIILLDIDRFKELNDTRGHAAGDSVLQKISLVLLAQVRITDIVCRYGGDEFVLVFPDTSRYTLEAAAERLRVQVRNLEMEHDGRLLDRTTISLGAALYPSHGTDRKSLVESADKALYRAKQDGRDRTVFSAGDD